MRETKRPTRLAQAGLTMVELMIAMAVMSTTLLAVAFAFARASGSYEEGQVDRALETQAHRTLDFVVGQFLDAGRDQIDPEPVAALAASKITFQRAQGWDGAAIVWGPDLLTFSLELEEGEQNDAADNNANGLVDERVLWWIVNEGQPAEERRVVTRWVRELALGETLNADDDNGNGLEDEAGVSFELAANVLTFRLTLERIGSEGRVVTYDTATSVRLRN